jgi:hypothetical protein
MSLKAVSTKTTIKIKQSTKCMLLDHCVTMGIFNDFYLHLGALGDWEIPKKLYFCEQFSSEFGGIFMEYILILRI